MVIKNRAARRLARLASFFRSPTGAKGNPIYDPLMRMQLQSKTLEPAAARMFYEQLWMARNVADVYAEDLTRAGFTVEIPDRPELVDIVESYLRRLQFQTALHSACLNEAIYGDGGIVLNIADGRDPASPVDRSSIQSVRHLNAFGRTSMADIVIQDDVTKERYGYATAFKFHVPSARGRVVVVDASRVLHLQMRGLADDKWGSSVFVPMLQVFQALETAEWTAAQLMRMMVFRVLKSDFTTDTTDDEDAINAELEKELDALTAMLIGKDEELYWLSPTGSIGSGVREFLDFLWECYAGAARIPKAHLIGQQQGTLSGASFDTVTWYNRVSGLQESYLREIVERLVSYILLAKDGGNLSPEELDELNWRVRFNALMRLSDVEQVEVDLKRAQERQIYIDLGVASPDDVAAQVSWVKKTPMQRVVEGLGDRGGV